jgi:transcriptional regulator with XRE-family HTH domain
MSISRAAPPPTPEPPTEHETHDADETADESAPEEADSFGALIRAARKRHDLTLRDLSEEVELHFSYLSRIENDRLPHPPSEEVVRRLSRRLDLNADLAMVRAGWIPDWLKSYLTQNVEFTTALMDEIRKDPDAPSLERLP